MTRAAAGQVRARLREDAGVTLVEMMVVMVLMGILATVALNMITGTLNSTLRTSAQTSQLSNQQQTFGFLNSRLASAGQIGGGCGNDCDLAISADQMMFVSAGNCYRIFYQAERKEVRAASTDSTSCESIKPKRAPNATVAEPKRATDSTTRMDATYSTDSDYDPVLDDSSKSYSISSSIYPEGKNGEDADPFVYLDRNGEVISGPTPNSVLAVRATFYMGSLLTNITSGPGSVPAKTVTQTIWLNQSPSGTGGGGGEPEPPTPALLTKPGAAGDAVTYSLSRPESSQTTGCDESDLMRDRIADEEDGDLNGNKDGRVTGCIMFLQPNDTLKIDLGSSKMLTRYVLNQSGHIDGKHLNFPAHNGISALRPPSTQCAYPAYAGAPEYQCLVTVEWSLTGDSGSWTSINAVNEDVLENPDIYHAEHTLTEPVKARYVRLRNIGNQRYMDLREFRVYGYTPTT